RGARASSVARDRAPGGAARHSHQGGAVRGCRSAAARRFPAAQAVSDQRARLPRVVVAIRVVSLELHAMSGSRAPRVVRYVLLGCACLGAIFLFLLATASANTALFARSYNLLLVLNGVMVVALMGLVGYQLLRLRRNLRAGVFGSRLAARLVLLFALVAGLARAPLYRASLRVFRET